MLLSLSFGLSNSVKLLIERRASVVQGEDQQLGVNNQKERTRGKGTLGSQRVLNKGIAIWLIQHTVRKHPSLAVIPCIIFLFKPLLPFPQHSLSARFNSYSASPQNNCGYCRTCSILFTCRLNCQLCSMLWHPQYVRIESILFNFIQLADSMWILKIPLSG